MKVLITGATGYLGSIIIPYFSNNTLYLFARNEHKLSDLKKKYPQAEIMIGDVRDRERVMSKIKGCDLVIHAAALKRVDSASDPQEMIKTNIIGSMNVMDACIKYDIPHAIFISSDKAFKPTNLYGKTKAVVEDMVFHRCPKYAVVRYGNVVGSTGAVIPSFIEKAKKGLPLGITNPEMTRFLITKKQAEVVVIRATKHTGLILPLNLRSVKIEDAAKWIIEYLDSDSILINISQFYGEKIHEEIEDGIISDKFLIGKDEFINLLIEEGLI